MDGQLHQLVADVSMPLLIGIMVISIAALGKGADWLVDEAVAISLRFGIPRMVVGATLVSLGTTTPEAVVSVLAAVTGDSQIALGNAVGSIICDTGLILGLACLVMPLPVDPKLVGRQGWIQFASGVLLIVCCIPLANPRSVFSEGSTLPQVTGFVFCGLLVIYLWWSVRQAGSGPPSEPPSNGDEKGFSIAGVALKLTIAIALVVLASAFLIASAKEAAERFDVPKGIISATIVAFGTSLPELVTAMTAVRKKQGELAVGNVIGADILNVLFVAGAAAAVTPAGLFAEPSFFILQFPAMLLVLSVFRVGIWRARGNVLSRTFGAVLLLTYIAVTVGSYFFAVRPDVAG